jgi:hypothetical protein
MRPSTRLLMMAMLALAFDASSAELDAVHLTSTVTRLRGAESTVPRTPGWRADELALIAQADDFKVVTYRDDHVSLGVPTWTWSVTVDGELYTRAYTGVRAGWYRSAVRERAGQISAAGMTRLVAFEPVSGAINEKIDSAYRDKYRGSRYLETMLGERASAATLRIKPAQ